MQFQDNVEHSVLLKDIRPQKVCIANRKIAILLFPFRNQISSLSGQSYNKKLKNVRIDILPWRENQGPRKGPMQSLTPLVRAPSNQVLPARSPNLKVMMEKQRNHLQKSAYHHKAVLQYQSLEMFHLHLLTTQKVQECQKERLTLHLELSIVLEKLLYQSNHYHLNNMARMILLPRLPVGLAQVKTMKTHYNPLPKVL